MKIGSFSAASNVTGIVTDVGSVATLLHAHGALSFWDYAAAAPHVDIAAGRGDDPTRIDAAFLSPHKFVSGPGTPGVLIVRRELVTNRVPTVPGGGTVAYVNPEEQVYLEDPVAREEGGTPDIVGAIRAGLVFQLKQAVGTEAIRSAEESFLRRAIASWSACPALDVLGNLDAERLSIVSFVIRRPGGRYLHHNFVVSLLNDLFGIQSRGGCSCAGPYGHRLLGIDIERSHEFEREIALGCEGIKPGWVRVSFNYFISEAVFNFIACGALCGHPRRALPHRLPLRPADRAVAAPARPGGTAAAAGRGDLRPADRRDALPPARRDGAGVGAGPVPGRGRRADRGACRPGLLGAVGAAGRLRGAALVRPARECLTP